MSNELQIFKNEQFGEIRVIKQNGEPWFVGREVCELFGDTNYRRSLGRLDDDEKGVSQIDTAGGKQRAIIVNEAGLYSLLFYMQPQKAKGVSQNDTLLTERINRLKTFKRWITHEVIPAIRKTGGYNAKNKTGVSDEVQHKRAEAMLLNARTRQSKAWMNISDKTSVPEYKRICQQKAAEALAGVPCLPMEEAKERTYSATEVGNILGISAMKVGQLANKYNLKTQQYGKYFYSKSEHSCKEVETFRYYQCAISKLDELLKAGA